ncbi:MAG TPA: TolC family protein [Terriglobales bacterium]|nr:TolC family protein [Terriglobales bacterium]
MKAALRAGSLFCLLLLVPQVNAQTITLRHAVELAVTHSGQATLAAADRDKALAAYHEARSAYLPRLVLGTGIGSSYGFPLSLENSAPSLFNVTSQQIVYSPAQKQFVRSARVAVEATDSLNVDQRDALIQETVVTYIELSKWTQDNDILLNALANDQKTEQIEQERIAAGVDKPVDLDRAKLATARIQMRMAEAKGSADVLRLHLAQLTGLSAEELDTDPDSIPIFPEVSQGDDLAKKAVQSSPAIKAAQQQALSKQFAAVGEHKALYPSFDLAGQYALLSNFNNYQVYLNKFQNNNASGGLVVKFPFFDTTQRARAAEAKADFIRASREAEGAKDRMSLETLRLQRSVQELQAAVDVAQLEYQLAQSELANTETRLQSQVGTLREEQDARTKVEQAYDALTDANLTLQKAKIQLLRNTGELQQWALAAK